MMNKPFRTGEGVCKKRDVQEWLNIRTLIETFERLYAQPWMHKLTFTRQEYTKTIASLQKLHSCKHKHFLRFLSSFSVCPCTTKPNTTQTYTILLFFVCNGPTGSWDDIKSDNVLSAPWILELLTMPSARLDPIIKVSSKETNWISAGICNWKLAFNDALWSRTEPSVDINQTSPCRDRWDCVALCSINIIRGIRFIWSWESCLIW